MRERIDVFDLLRLSVVTLSGHPPLASSTDRPPSPPENIFQETNHSDPAANMSQTFEGIADDLLPKLHPCLRIPQKIVRFEKASLRFLGLEPCTVDHDINDLSSLSWGKGSEFILDFGIHMVGFLSFRLDYVGQNMDAPCRLRLTFGESPLDVTMDMDNVKTWISTAWLPDEVINVDTCPQTIHLPRRYSFRYLRVQIIDTSAKFKVSFSNVQCESVSAVAQDHQIDAVEFPDPLLQDIDHVCISTLRDCMQTVFEDGPRRDRRLWIGDLRLQALANYSTFRDFNLVKRCLFQFAAVRREDGSLPACIFEKPTLTASTDYIIDYDALFAAIVYDYVEASRDTETGHLLWETVLSCVKRLRSNLNPDSYVFEAERTKHHIFLDWTKGLDKSAGAHGVLLYCLKATNKLAVRLNKEPPYNDLILKMTDAANSFLKDGVFASGETQQVSYASAAWLVLCEAFPPEIARKALLATLAHPDAVKPLTPYLWHHVCDALAKLECYDECVDLIRSYWGGMVEAGADTFWECYDEQDCMASPYGDVRNNSWCHAWSCTPTYLLRTTLWKTVKARRMGKITMGELDQRWIERSPGNDVI